MKDDPYVYPGTTVLRNKLGIRDAALLGYHERELVTDRIAQGVPGGDFDLGHLRSIHRHLFQDVYEWAGEIRTVEMSKGASQFQSCQYIPTGVDYVYRQIIAARYLTGLSKPDFAALAAVVIGNVNYAHPFLEGNGRTQLQYLKQLAERAGHTIDLRELNPDPWLHASRESHAGRSEPMARAILAALVGRGR